MGSQARHRRSFGGFALGLIVAFLLPACAARIVEPPVPSTPRFPDFAFPAAAEPGEAAETPAALDRGWRFLQAGDLAAAEREWARGLKGDRGSRRLAAAMAWLDLARGRAASALGRFDAVLDGDPAMVAGLVGRGIALIDLGRLDEAVAAFERALALDPGLDEVASRIEVLRLRSRQGALAGARAEADAGRHDAARLAYLRALEVSPDSAVVYRELARVERAAGDAAAAADHLRRAVGLDAGDAGAWSELCDALDDLKRFDEAERACLQASELAPSPAARARLELARRRAALARLPAEYAAIATATEVTRGDLAALIGVRFTALVSASPRPAALLVDARGHWAAEWIQQVVAAGVMDSFPNYAFRPRQPLRRSELASAASRLLELAEKRRPGRLGDWAAASPSMADLPRSHLAYPAAAIAVAAGILDLGPDRRFQPARAVSGAEAARAIDRVEELVR